jgi:hypothetical protein
MPHRASLEEAAEGKPAGRATTPDLEGVTHIPESQLPRRHDRMGTSLPPLSSLKFDSFLRPALFFPSS